MTLSNTARLTRIYDVLHEDAYCLEAAQIRSWMDGLSVLALTKIDDMDTGILWDFYIRLSSAMLLGDNPLDTRERIASVLADFTDQHLNFHAIV